VVDTGTWLVAATEGVAVGTVVAVVGAPLPVHPAANASMNTATMLRLMSKYDLFFAFMVFTRIINLVKYTLFRHNL
jgi:hypothetical protein